MFRFVIAFLFLLALYHIARFAEVLYRVRKDFLDRVKALPDTLQNFEEKKKLKRIVLKEKESLLVHHCIWGGPFVWIIALPVYFILRDSKEIKKAEKDNVQG